MRNGISLILLIMLVIFLQACSPTEITPELSEEAVETASAPTEEATAKPPDRELRALVQITPGGNINASTFEPGSLAIFNLSAENVHIRSLQIDLSSAILPDIVFDPNGGAGDHVAKDLSIDESTGATYATHNFDSPHDDGFDTLTVHFDAFEPGGAFRFSIDIDPTSIHGGNAPGPRESGSVSGLEMTGAIISATFAVDGEEITLVAQAFRAGDSRAEAEIWLRQAIPEAPTLSLLGVSTPGTISEPEQLMQLTGPSGAKVSLLQLEAGLFIEGAPNGGFDLDPFESNSIHKIGAFEERIGADGVVEIPITLWKTHALGGINLFAACIRDDAGACGLVSNIITVELTRP